MSFLFGSSKTTNQSSTPTLTGQGQGLFDALNNFSSDVLKNPSAGLQPIQNAGEEAINSSYGNIPRVISSAMAKRGYGSSGVMGNSMYQTQLGRLNSQSQFQGQMADLASKRQMSAADIMQQMLRTQVGSSGYSKTTTMDPMAAFSALGSLLMMGGLGGGGGISDGGSGLFGQVQDQMPPVDWSAMPSGGMPGPFQG